MSFYPPLPPVTMYYGTYNVVTYYSTPPTHYYQSRPSMPVEKLDDYYVGVDLGQKRDYSVVAAVRKKDRHVTLVHLKQFPLGTEGTQVIDYLKLVAEEFKIVRAYYIDQTGIGVYFVENARKHGLKNVNGIVLTMPQKQDVMTCLKQVAEEGRLHIPNDSELVNQMGGQMAELTSTGKTKFYHRTGTHDDKLWAFALAVYADKIRNSTVPSSSRLRKKPEQHRAQPSAKPLQTLALRKQNVRT